MRNNNGRFRKRKIFFTQVSNVALRDTNLSLKAKGLYSLIQSYITIEDFTLYKSTLKKQCTEGESAFESTWKELKKFGYLIQYKIQDEKGKFFYEYELLEEPQIEETSQSIHPPKNHHVDNTPSGKSTLGKGGVFNNTNLNNTNLNNTNINNISSSKEEAGEKKEEDKFESDLKYLMSFCNNINFKLKKDKAKSILKVYGIDKIIKAITHIIGSVDISNIRNFGAYLMTTLKDMSIIKKVVIENKIENGNKNKTSNFANFTQRKYDYEKLEKNLLGWSNDEFETFEIKDTNTSSDIEEMSPLEELQYLMEQ